MNELYIKRLSVHDGMDVYQMLQQIGSEENGFSNSACGLSFEEFKEWLCKQQERAEWSEPHHNIVPQTMFWLYADGVPVGVGKIRHQLNEELREDGGNVGYAIAREKRGKGYATVLLSQLLQTASDMHIGDILLTVEKSNLASKCVIEKNGGRLVRETDKRWYFDCKKEDK